MKYWWLAIRPRTLGVSIACMLLGHGLAWQSGEFSWPIALLSTAVAMSLQISVNLANDYFDGVKGIDDAQRLGPLRVTQAGLIAPAKVWGTTLVFLTFGVVIGLILLWQSGSLGLTLAGAICVFSVLRYSGGASPLASRALGEVTVFLCFGWIGVLGSYYLQTNTLPFSVWLAASQLGFLVSAVMLVNNNRDRLSDQKANKRTLAVMLGAHRGRQLYCVLLYAPFALQLLQLLLMPSHPWLIIPFFLLPLAYHLCCAMLNSQDHELNPLLGKTTLFSLLLSATLVLSAAP